MIWSIFSITLKSINAHNTYIFCFRDELAEKRPYSGTGDNGMSQYNASPSVAWNMPPPMNQQMAQSPYMI